MTGTSAQAAKLLRKLNDEYASLRSSEDRSREFCASVGEDVASVRPAYDYAAMQQRLEALDTRIRRLKHAISVFNVTHKVQGYDMTVDEMLVYLPQLTRRRDKLALMKEKLPKARVEDGRMLMNVIDYTYTNYDPAEAARDYERVSDELARAQIALDVTNNTDTFSFDE